MPTQNVNWKDDNNNDNDNDNDNNNNKQQKPCLERSPDSPVAARWLQIREEDRSGQGEEASWGWTRRIIWLYDVSLEIKLEL